MVIIIAIFAYLLLTAIVTLSVCVLSAKMRRHEDWEETPLVEQKTDGRVPDYQTELM